MNKFINHLKKHWPIYLTSLIILGGCIASIICSIKFGSVDVLFSIVSTWISFLGTIGIGVLAFWQNKKFKETNDKNIEFQRIENQKEREQQLLMTCPIITFDSIDACRNDTTTVVYGEDSNYLALIDDDGNIPNGNVESPLMFRLRFKCDSRMSLKNISVKDITIYPQVNEDMKFLTSSSYNFRSKYMKPNRVNVSYIGSSTYQVIVWLLFGTEKTTETQFAIFENDKIKKDLMKIMSDSSDKSKIFINLRYQALNIFNVCYDATLKFYCKACKKGESLEFYDYENISNWIEKEPYILKEKEKNNE